MDRAEYHKLDWAEDRMWWFAALHANLLMLYRRMSPSARSSKPVLDAGCGTGGLLAKAAAALPRDAAIGLDADYRACARAAAKSARPICNGSVNALPFGDGVFSAIFSADVLCHRGVDESTALAQFRDCLVQDGLLFLNLPAYQWMLSRHDMAVYNIRRYTRKGLAQLLRASGFRVLYISYWNAALFPIMVLTRKLLPGRAGSTSDVAVYPPPVEAFCSAATWLERAIMRCGARLPFGGSVIAVAAKTPGAEAAGA